MTAVKAAVAPLTITLFGPLQVLVDGQPLPHMRSRKCLWLLALLTLRHDRPIEREWLAGTLWPDMDQSQGFASLRPILSELRSALGDQSARLQSPDRHTLLLDLTGAEVDLLAFDAAIASKKLSALELAVALYRGPLLEGCNEEWAPQERAVREQNCLQALLRLADAARMAGDDGTVIRYYQQAVSIDSWMEAARRGLMQALAKSGDTNAALQVYREFRDRLRKDDPNAVPDEQTTALYQHLRSQERHKSTYAVVTPEAATMPMVKGYLPHPLTALVGRQDECLEVAVRLRRSRLVTLTGFGGIGKTRLAREIAGEVVKEYADGVWLVALEALTEGKSVVPQIASVLGVKEEPGRRLLQSVTEHLDKKHLLLVLDNCEHLLEASGAVAEHLLRECGEMRILATSREALGITGEMAWSVPTLAVPEPAHLPQGCATLLRVLMGYESVQLFVERAQAVQKTFVLTGSNARTVARVCRQLEGIPLALELAATRVKAMAVEQMASRLNNHLNLLTGGSRTALPRQQTLRATLDWSYELLMDGERLLLRRLSVFAGGWSLEAAEHVCAGDGVEECQLLDLLTSLVDKSLVVFEEHSEGNGDGRFHFLEMVRQYAAEGLRDSGEAERVRDRHLAWFVARAEEAEPELKGVRQMAWLRQLDVEYDNLRAALAWSETGTREVEWGQRLTGALWWFWRMQGRFSEGRKYLVAALEREGAQSETAVRAKVLNRAGALAFNMGDYAAARTLHEESLLIYQKLENRQGAATALLNLGNLVNRQGDHAAAISLFQESLGLYREAGDKHGIATILGNLGAAIRLLGDYAAARTLYEESLQICRDLGNEQGIGLALANLGNLVRLQGDYGAARTWLEESLEIRRKLGDKQGIAFSLSSLGSMAGALGNHADARVLHEESLSLRRELGDKQSIAWSLSNLGLAALRESRFVEAGALFEESLSIFRELGDRGGVAWSLNHLGDAAHQSGEDATARRRFADSLSLFRELEDKEGVAENLRDLAAVLAMQAEWEMAARLWGAAEALRQSIGAPLPLVEHDNYDRQVQQARSALGAIAFAAAWEAGRALNWEQSIAYALAETVPGQSDAIG